MTRCWPFLAAALVFLLQDQVQGADVATCAAEGRCRKDIAGETPVSLMQTKTSVTARSVIEQASHDSMSTPLGRVDLDLGLKVGTNEKITPPKEAFKDNHLLTAMVCCLGALCAAFVQAVLAVYNALTFHFFCAAADFIFVDSFRVGVSQSTVYICCYYPIMDVMQMFKFWDAKRNWSLLLCYGIPLFFGLFAGLSVLHFAYSQAMVIGLQAFLLFSCLVALGVEGYSRIKQWRAGMAAQEQASKDKRELPVETCKPGPDDAAPGFCEPKKGSKTQELVPSKPPSVDMSDPFNMAVAMFCGGFGGFSLGAIGIGGTFVLLMLNTLKIGIDEWRCTQCVAEIPLHFTRAIIVMSLGMVNWTEEWMNVAGVYVGTVAGIMLGNQFAPYIQASVLRGVVLVGICITVVVLSVSIINKID